MEVNKPKYDDELKFKELLKKPYRLFGWFYMYIIVIILAGGIYFVKHLDNVSFNSLEPRLASDTLEIPKIEMKKGGIQLAANLDLIQNPTDELIAKGKELFTNTCASCHGKTGEGNGPAGLNLNPKPRNFHSKDGWTNGRKFSQMFKTLTEGIIKNGMAAYEYIPADDRFALIHYIRTFENDFPEITNDEVKEMEITYHLLEGQKQPNTIPVELAMQKLENEKAAPIVEKVDEIITKIKSEKKRYELVKSVSKDVRSMVGTVIANGLNEDFDKFKSALLYEPLDLGFNAKVLRLSEKEMKELFGIFNNI